MGKNIICNKISLDIKYLNFVVPRRFRWVDLQGWLFPEANGSKQSAVPVEAVVMNAGIDEAYFLGYGQHQLTQSCPRCAPIYGRKNCVDAGQTFSGFNGSPIEWTNF